MNEVEYILRIVLKARDELAGALAAARRELRGFARDAENNKGKIEGFNEALSAMDKNVKDVSDRFKEWRAVMQGVDDDNTDAKKSISDLNKEIEKNVKTSTAAAKSQKDLSNQTKELGDSFIKLDKDFKAGEVSRRDYVADLSRIGKEYDRLSARAKIGSELSRTLRAAGDEARRQAKIIVDADKERSKSLDEVIRKSKAAGESQDELIKKVRGLYREYKKVNDAEKEGNIEKAYAVEHYKRIGREIEAVFKKLNANTTRSAEAFKRLEAVRGSIQAVVDAQKKAAADTKRINADALRDEKDFQKSLDAERNRAVVLRRLRDIQGRMEKGPIGEVDTEEAKDVVQHLRQVSREFQRTSREARGLRAAAAQLNGTLRNNSKEVEHDGHLLRQFGQIISENKESVSTLDNQLRGIGWLAAFAFAQELITVLGGLGGAFVAVASSAAQAGAAIGGTFVAGIAQAMPSIGLLGAALSRVGGVMDAVKQAQNAQKAEAVQGAGAARRVADATDTVRNAQEALANANRGVSDAQKDLTQARKDAKEELEDLAAAEKQADLAARGAVLSQKEAQEALRLAMASGDVEGIARAELGVLEAQADAEEKLKDARKARIDAAKGEKGGVEGTEGVQQAKRSLEDAERAAAKASRGIETAKRNAGEAAAGTQTAAANLNYLLAQLSPAERRLYTALTNIQEAYKKTYRPITDLIIDSFTRSVKGVQRIMLMPEVIQMARRTAQQIARQLNRIFDAFTSAPMIKQFLRISEEGRKNLVPLTTIIIRLGKAFFNIAEASGPALRRLLRFVSDLVGQFLDLTKQKGKMEDFFTTGEKHFEAWVKLGLAVVRLFMALAGAGGAQTGVQLVKDATKAIEDLIQKVNDNKDAIKDFFGDSREIIHEIVGVIVALAIELHKAFTPENIHRFAELLKTVIIPAFGTALEWISKITTEVLKFTSTDFGRKVATFTVAFFFFSKVLGSTFGLLIDFVRFLGVFGRAFGVVAQAVGKVFPGLGRVVSLLRVIGPQMARVALGAAAPWLLVAGAIVFLLAKLGLLDDLWEELKEAFNALWGQLEPPLKRLVDAFKNLFAAVDAGKGPLGVLLDILRPLFKILIEVGGFLLEGIAKAIGQVLGGIIDIVGGFINILAGLLSGDLGMVWDGIKQVLLGIGNAIIGLLQLLLFRGVGGAFRAVGGLLFRGLRAAGRLIWDFLRSLPRAFFEIAKDVVQFFMRGFGRLGRGIRSVVSDAWQWLKGLPGRFWELAKDIAQRFWRGYQRMGRILRGAINDAWEWLKKLPGRFWELAKDIVSFFWRGYRNLGRMLRRAIEDAWDWIKGFPKRFEDLAKDAVKLFVNAFKGLGKKIVDIFSDGLSGAGNFAKKLINGIFKLIEDGWNKGVGGKKVLGVSLPDIHIPRLAGGGPVPGSGRGDRIAALLEPGEHVLTRQEVAALGGHGVVFALRRALGGGGQGTGGRYAEGGKPEISAGSLTITFQGGDLDDFASAWRQFWLVLALTARRATDLIEKYFRDMRVNTTRSADRMYRDIDKSLDRITASFRSHGRRNVTIWSDMWEDLMKVTHKALFYIGHETNQGLKGLGEKTINFGFKEPTKGKAGGGWIGSKGHRGRDRGFYPLGAGEAVLNWQHQRYVEPAMNAYYGHGLTDMFNRTRGYHAGGPGQAGFAGGGFAPIPGYPGEEAATRIIPLLVKLIKQYHIVPTDVYDRDHSAGHKSPGHNVTGTALDAVPQVPSDAGWNAIEAMGKWAVSKGMTVGYGAGVPGSQPWPGHGRGNHIHIELGSNPGEVGAFLAAATEIGRPKISGTAKKLVELSQAAVDMVLKAANEKLAETFPAVSGTTSFKLGPGGAAQKVFDFFTARGLSDAIAAGFVGTFQKESNFVTTVTNAAGSGATGLAQWLGGRLTALKAKPNWTSLQTQLNFVWEELHGAESGAFAAIKGARTPEEAAQIIDSQYERSDNILNAPGYARAAYNKFHGTGKRKEYAKGGEIPGPDGYPVPILAHAREWILNAKQQSRLANMMGVSRGVIKRMLGFPGQPGRAFQVGGEVEAGAADESLLNRGVTTRGVRERLRRLRQGLYELPVLPLQSWEAAMREAKRAFLAIRRRGRGFSKEVEDINEQIKELQKGEESKAELTKIKKLKADRKRLIESGTMVKEVQKVNDEIKELQKGDEDRQQRRQIAKLVQERRRLQRRGRAEVAIQARLQSLQALVREGGIIDSIDAARERFTSTLARRLTFATFRFNRASGRVRQRMDDVEIATKELENTRREMRKILGEEGVITKALKKVNNRIRALRRGGVTEEEAPELRELVTMQVRLREQRASIRDLHAQQLQRIYEAQVARQQAVIDEINARAERDIGAQEIARRMGEAVGNEGMIDAANQAVRAIQQRQMDELQARVAAASRIGNTEMVNGLNQQIADLRATIFESIQQELRDAADRINARAQRRLGRLDLGGRMLDAMGRVGLGSVASVAGEQFTRGGLFAQRGATLQQQRGELQGLLGRAGAAGNIALVQDLTDQLAELEVAIQENTKSYFDARVEDVNNRTSYSLNINDLNKRITELKGVAAGQIDQQAITNSLMERGNILTQQRIELEALLAEAQRTGNQQAVQDLTVALLENQIAVLENTAAVEEANGLMKEPQTFTSSAWTRFREAVFTGMGQVLPQYDPGNMMGEVNTGAVIYPSVTTSSRTSGDTNINLYESGRPPDLTEISSAVTFASKTAQ